MNEATHNVDATAGQPSSPARRAKRNVGAVAGGAGGTRRSAKAIGGDEHAVIGGEIIGGAATPMRRRGLKNFRVDVPASGELSFSAWTPTRS